MSRVRSTMKSGTTNRQVGAGISKFLLVLAATAFFCHPAFVDAGDAKAPQTASLEPETNPYQELCDGQVQRLDAMLSELENLAPPFTAASVLEPLNDFEIALNDAQNLSSLYEAVHPDWNTQKTARDCTASFSDLRTRLDLSRPVYEAVSQVDVSAEPEDTRRYHFLVMRSFGLAGVDKDKATRRIIRMLQDEITRLSQQFDKNILEDVRYLEIDPEQLAGLPGDYLNNLSTAKNGKIWISTRRPDIYPIYTYAESDWLRRELRRMERSRGYPQNEPVLKKLLKRRHQLAELLGFENYADYVTADKMAGNAANVDRFVSEVRTAAESAIQLDQKKLLDRLQQIDPEATRVERWQISYLKELVRRDQYRLDAAELRRYFAFSRVKQGIFDLVSDLFEVEIKPWETDVWHPSVEAYAMYREGRPIARFYLDMHPRLGKYQHAAVFSTQVGIKDRQLPITTLVGNFPGEYYPNARLEFAQVNTFFHEFGHLIHSLFGGHQRWARLSGIATEWDFVEVPSQLFEEWLYDPATLRNFATRADGDPIPKSLIKRLNRARWFGKGLDIGIQTYYAALSLNYHSRDPEEFELLPWMLEIESRYSPLPHQDDTYFFANLGHLSGYSAMYYTYLWSEVIAADLLAEFEKKGLHDGQIAGRYRDLVLARGGAKPAAELVEDFLGHPYNFDAFAGRLTTEGRD